MGLAYGEARYWDERYAKNSDAFDWYQSYAGLSPLLRKLVPLHARILMVGCGISDLSLDMVADGYRDIVNIDISEVCIRIMQEKHAGMLQLQYMQMDGRNLGVFSNCSFGAVIDKGTLDSLMCGDKAHDNAKAMLLEIFRVLADGGVYMTVTYGDPRARLSHLTQPGLQWSTDIYVLPRPGSTREEDSERDTLEPIIVGKDGSLGHGMTWDDADIHYVYLCTK